MPDLHDSEALPAVSVVEFSDPTVANHGYELVSQDAVQLQSRGIGSSNALSAQSAG